MQFIASNYKVPKVRCENCVLQNHIDFENMNIAFAKRGKIERLRIALTGDR